jgi:hypothetical protein
LPPTDPSSGPIGRSSARELAERILVRDLASADTSTATAAVVAAERVFHRLGDNLVRWVGAEGSQALFARARAIARAQNQALRVVPPPARSALFLDALASSTDPQDTAAVLDGAVTILTSLIELLTRLVGEELATQLLTDGSQVGSTDAPRSVSPERTS